jgi:hypothetical protein
MQILPENRKNLLLLGGGMVLALVVLLLVVKMGHKSSPEAGPPGSSVIVTQPTPTPSPTTHQKASALVFTGRNPFAPLTVASSSPSPAPSGSPTPAPSVSPAGSPAPGPGDGSSVTIGGHTVVLDDLFTSSGTGKAQVEVDGQVYTVSAGQMFASSFKLVTIHGTSSADFLYGDQSFSLTAPSTTGS